MLKSVKKELMLLLWMSKKLLVSLIICPIRNLEMSCNYLNVTVRRYLKRMGEKKETKLKRRNIPGKIFKTGKNIFDWVLLRLRSLNILPCGVVHVTEV